MARLLRFAPDVTAGSIPAPVTLTYPTSYAAPISSGPPLDPSLARGFHAALVAAALVALVVALKSSFPAAIAGPDSNASAILAVMAAGLTRALGDMHVAGDRIANSVALMLVLTAVVSGLIVALLGALRCGRLVRLIPYPVCGGFLSALGFLLLGGAFKVLTGQSLGWSPLLLLAAEPALAWGTAFAVAIALLVLTRAVRYFLVLPGVFVAAVIAF